MQSFVDVQRVNETIWSNLKSSIYQHLRTFLDIFSIARVIGEQINLQTSTRSLARLVPWQMRRQRQPRLIQQPQQNGAIALQHRVPNIGHDQPTRSAI